MTTPRENSTCNALTDAFEVCGLKFVDHWNVSHTFIPRPAHKEHLFWEAKNTTYCGWQTDECWDVSYDVSDAYVRGAARNNILCISCLKQWMFVRDRISFFTSVKGRVSVLKGA